MFAPAEVFRWELGTRGSAMALVQSQQITGSGLGIALRPLLSLGGYTRDRGCGRLGPDAGFRD
jgi:hypothetical protein